MKKVLLVLLSLLVISCSSDEPEDSTSYCDSNGCIFCDYYDDYHDVECYGTGEYALQVWKDGEKTVVSGSEFEYVGGNWWPVNCHPIEENK